MPTYKLNTATGTKKFKSGIRKIKVLAKTVICDFCNTKTFSLTGKTEIGSFGVGKWHLIKCSKCNGELSIGEGTRD